jgi:hypothetical protein
VTTPHVATIHAKGLIARGVRIRLKEVLADSGEKYNMATENEDYLIEGEMLEIDNVLYPGIELSSNYFKSNPDAAGDLSQRIQGAVFWLDKEPTKKYLNGMVV